MTRRTFRIDADVARARLMPAAVYGDAEWAETQDRLLWPHVWHSAPPAPEPGAIRPFALRAGGLDEPLLLARDPSGEVRALSNVCTHRGLRMFESATACRTIRCRYHGRTFDLRGRMLSAPGFERCEDFPTEADDLPCCPLAQWRGLTFAALHPRIAFESWIRPVETRIGGFLERSPLPAAPATTTSYELDANWALYVDNYLEGFHVPFVHPALAPSFDFPSYRVETFEFGSLQVGVAADGEPAFEPPLGHPDHGQRIAGYFFFLFPTTMLNFYPWGLSLNRVEPLTPKRTRIVFENWVCDPSLTGTGAGADLHTVELEDESVVEATQLGVRSRLYRGGRYSPRHETGVHRFHRLMAEWLCDRKANPTAFDL